MYEDSVIPARQYLVIHMVHGYNKAQHCLCAGEDGVLRSALALVGLALAATIAPKNE